MKLIQWNDGTYGVYRRHWGTFFLKKEFLDSNGSYWWTTIEYINKYCKFKSEEAAIRASNLYTVIKTL